jgi:hypothetical protein
MYDHNTTEFRVRGADLDNHVAWIPKITKKLNAGSTWFMEIGHNGNGNIEVCLARNLRHSPLIYLANRQ